MTGALHHVQAGGEQRATAESEDHRIGVQWPQATVAQPRDVEVERRPDQLRGDDQAAQHADDAPYQGHHGKLANDLVVVTFTADLRRHTPSDDIGENILADCRSEEHTSEIHSLMRISYADFCLKTKINKDKSTKQHYT